MAANSLGGLIVTLGLNAAEFTSGLTKSEREAQKFAARLDRAIATGAKAASAAIIGIGAAAAVAFAAVNELSRQAGDFKDLEEKTGANAEALASFAVSAGTAGLAMAEVAALSVKLTKNLTGVDDESKSAGAAISALGLNLKEFKALDPAAQLEAIAKALAGFEDGAGKTAVMEALAKGASNLLPFLKELNSEGGRQVILTQQQIERADAYSDAQARARTQLQLYAQAAATEALPAITALTTAAKNFIIELAGIEKGANDLRGSTAILDFANNAVRALGFIVSAGQGLGRVFQVVGETIAAGAAQTAAVAVGDLNRALAIGRDWQTQIDGILNKQLFSAKLSQQIQNQQKNASRAAIEDRGFKPAGKPLRFSGVNRPDKAAGGSDRISEAQRFLDSLQKQLDRTLELTAVETALKEIQSGRLKGLTPDIERQILAVAAQVDAYKELEEWVKASGKAFDEEVKAMERAAQVQERHTEAAFREAEQIQQANRDLQDEIAIIVGGEAARKVLEKARISSAIAIKEEALAMAQLDPLRRGEAAALQSQITLLKERAELLNSKSFAEQLAADAANLQQFKDLFTNTFADAFSSFIDGTKSAKDAFKDFERSLVQSISRIASQNLAEALFGGKSNTGGPDFGKLISSLIGSFFGGGGGGFASGPQLGSFAAGTNFAPGGMALVGERGPELVNLPRGAQVIPNHELRNAGGNTYHTVINPPPGMSAQTSRQLARQVAGELQRQGARG